MWCETIVGAKIYIYVNAYCISDPDILRLLQAAHERGVDVRLRTDYTQQQRTVCNLDLYTICRHDLGGDGVMHKKELICDHACVVGSYNPTISGGTNQESVVLSVQTDVIHIFTNCFKHDWCHDMQKCEEDSLQKHANGKASSRKAI